MRKDLVVLVAGLSLLSPGMANGLSRVTERPQDRLSQISERTHFQDIIHTIYSYTAHIGALSRFDRQKIEELYDEMMTNVTEKCEAYLTANGINYKGAIGVHVEEHIAHPERLSIAVYQEEPGSLYRGCPLEGDVRLQIYPEQDAIEVYCPLEGDKPSVLVGVLLLNVP
jgi:hypothetical protein